MTATPSTNDTPKIFRITIECSNLDQAAAFYAKLLASEGKRHPGARHYFDCGGTILACYDPVADGDGEQGGWRHHPNQYIYFSVSDLEAAHQRAVEVGCKIVDGGIQEMPWGERMFWANDPYGNPISFVDEKSVFTG